MSLDMQAELTRFCTDHINTHGADYRAELYIKGCCDMWAQQFGKGIAQKVENAAMAHYRKKGGK